MTPTRKRQQKLTASESEGAHSFLAQVLSCMPLVVIPRTALAIVSTNLRPCSVRLFSSFRANFDMSQRVNVGSTSILTKDGTMSVESPFQARLLYSCYDPLCTGSKCPSPTRTRRTRFCCRGSQGSSGPQVQSARTTAHPWPKVSSLNKDKSCARGMCVHEGPPRLQYSLAGQ